MTDCADKRLLIVEHAKGWIGTPFQHQASVQGHGCDCLGLVRGIWRAVIGHEPKSRFDYGTNWTVGARPDALDQGLRGVFDAADIAPNSIGDVIAFRLNRSHHAQHLGITIGAINRIPHMIHSCNTTGVVEVPISVAWQRRCVGQYKFP